MPSSLAHFVWTHTQRDDLIRPGDGLLLAVSGGPDSMALLEVMRELAPVYDLSLHVAHIHHMLRPTDADKDRSFVRRYCRFVGVPCTTMKVDVPSRRRKTKESLEEAARILRYKALDGIRTQTDMRAIATGHHRDDQIETVLMRAMRGSDVRGLSGILPRLARPPVIRPLLRVPRRDILAYLNERRIPFRQDATNENVHMTRNRVRLDVIPRFRLEGEHEILDTLPRLADAARRLGQHLQEVLPLLVGARTEAVHGQLLVHIDTLSGLSEGLRRSYIGMVLSGLGVELASQRIEKVLTLISLSAGRRIVFRSSGVQVLRDREHLVFGPAVEHRTTLARLSPGGKVILSGSTILAGHPGPAPVRFPSDRSVAWVDAEKVSGGLRVRTWRAGDRFMPLGMQGRSKNVSDVLRDAYVPLYYKGSIPVVTHRGRIVWVCGIRPDERFKITPKTRRAIQLSYHPSV